MTSSITNPFATTPSVNAHGGFTPAKLDPSSLGPGHSSSSSGPLKAPKPPEKPLVPYMRFSRQMWHKVRDENPDCQLWDIGKKIGALWRELSPQEKHIYQEQWEVEKIEYDKQLKAYHNSAPYQEYLARKQQSGRGHRDREPARVESGVFIQSVDEDDGEYQASIRRVAEQRYQKNHRLISELFSPSNVLDTRTVVTQQRISMLKRQASSLSSHQKNLEKELLDLDTRFKTKRRMIEEASEQFSEQLKKACGKKPVFDDGKYEQMIQQASEKLLLAYQNYKDKQELAQPETETAAPSIKEEEEGDTSKAEEEQGKMEGTSSDPTSSQDLPNKANGSSETAAQGPPTAQS